MPILTIQKNFHKKDKKISGDDLTNDHWNTINKKLSPITKKATLDTTSGDIFKAYRLFLDDMKKEDVDLEDEIKIKLYTILMGEYEKKLKKLKKLKKTS